MKLNSVLLGVLIAGLTLAVLAQYLANNKLQSEAAQLRRDSEELQGLRAAQDTNDVGKGLVSGTELARLRKDSEDVLRLRNEVNQLRQERQELSRQLQAAQGQAQAAQAQVQTLSQKSASPPVAGTFPGGMPPGVVAGTNMTPAALDQFRARYGLPPANPEQAKIAACINNLRMIDAAKQRWALENRKPQYTYVTAADIAPHLVSNTIPVCPAGGVYAIGTVGVSPTCSIPGHTLAK